MYHLGEGTRLFLFAVTEFVFCQKYVSTTKHGWVSFLISILLVKFCTRFPKIEYEQYELTEITDYIKVNSKSTMIN